MSDPRPALEALLGELTRRGSSLSSRMRPGLPADEVVSRMSEAGARPHADVVSLYVWHDGFDRFRVPISPDGMVALFPSHREFNPLDDTMMLFAQWREMAAADAAVPVRQADGSWGRTEPEQVWSRSWFPVFHGGGSEVISISNDEANAGSVWLHPIQDAPRRLYDNLSDAAEAIRMALIDGRLVLDSKGVFTLESIGRSGIEL
jgi:cell wall assembly regulator SMI1